MLKRTKKLGMVPLQRVRNMQPGLFGGLKSDKDPFASKPTSAQRDTTDHGILALDVSTTTGWCDCSSSGTWQFNMPAKKTEMRIGETTRNGRLLKFYQQLVEKIDFGGIKLVVFERPLIHSGTIKQGGTVKKRNPNFVSYEFIGVLKMLCEQRGIKTIQYHAAHIKKAATGQGNAEKAEMITACIRRYNITPIDDNQADAIHLYYLALQDLQL